MLIVSGTVEEQYRRSIRASTVGQYYSYLSDHEGFIDAAM